MNEKNQYIDVFNEEKGDLVKKKNFLDLHGNEEFFNLCEQLSKMNFGFVNNIHEEVDGWLNAEMNEAVVMEVANEQIWEEIQDGNTPSNLGNTLSSPTISPLQLQDVSELCTKLETIFSSTQDAWKILLPNLNSFVQFVSDLAYVKQVFEEKK